VGGDTSLVAASAGAHFTVHSAESGKQLFTSEGVAGAHTANIRCLHFSPSGSFLATGGDDKQLKLWSTKDWSCYRSSQLAKKVTAVAISQDSEMVIASDKFGEAVKLAASSAVAEAKSEFLLGHMSLVTSMLLVDGDKFVVTADRDEHVRVSHFPDAYDIHTILLGHKVFVTALAAHKGLPGLVVSGDGKGEIRVWRHTDSVEVACTQVSSVEGISETAILSMALGGEGDLAVQLQGAKTVLLYKLDAAAGSLVFQRQLDTQRHGTRVYFDATGVLYVASNALREAGGAAAPHVECFRSTPLEAFAHPAAGAINEGLSKEEVATETGMLGKGITQGELHKTYHDQGGKKRPKHNHEIKEIKQAANAAKKAASAEDA